MEFSSISGMRRYDSIMCVRWDKKNVDERVYSDDEFPDDRSTVMFIDYDCPNETAFRVGSACSV